MADTPVFGNPAGLTGRVNVGGGGTLKIVSGSVSVPQTSGQLITTVDFTPLVIFTAVGSRYAEEGWPDTVDGYHISYRAKSTDAWQSRQGKYAYTHVWQETTGKIFGYPDVNYGYQNVNVTYAILGV